MSTAKTFQIDCTSLEDTLNIAEAIGRNCRGGEVIELIGDLGSGKTSFVRGLAKGMGSGDTVSSPSFTISNRYQAGELVLHHFDFYRLHEPGILAQELAELLDDKLNIIVTEWANIADSSLPPGRLKIHFGVISDQARRLAFSVGDQYQYLIPQESLTG